MHALSARDDFVFKNFGLTNSSIINETVYISDGKTTYVTVMLEIGL